MKTSIRQRTRYPHGNPVIDFKIEIRHNGQRIRKFESTEADANIRLAKMLAELAKAPTVAKADPGTLNEYGEAWLAAQVREGRLKKKTLLSYADLFRCHVARTLGKKPLRSITRHDVKQWIGALRAQTAQRRTKALSANTVRLARSILSVIMADAVDSELIAANPADQPVRKRGSKSVKIAADFHPFDADELARILETARRLDPAYYPLFLLLAATGVRPGEAFALRWEDIDWNKRQIRIERGLSAGEFDSPKTNAGRRIVDMNSELARVLAAEFKKAEALRDGTGKVRELIFTTLRRGHLHLSAVRLRFMRVLRKAGIGRHRLYDLRHSFASLHLSAGHPLVWVSLRLGHANPSITLKYYGRWLPSAAQNFADDLAIGVAPRHHETGTTATNVNAA